MNKLLLSLAAVAAFTFTAAAETTDVINQAATGVTGTAYTAGTITTTNSGAKYAFQCAGDKGSVQLRSKNSNSGVVTTKSGGKIKSIKVSWNDATTSTRVLNVYASNTAYTDPTDLYTKDLKYVTQLKLSEAKEYVSEYTFTENYAYVGFRSADGAMYLNSIELTWDNGSTGPTISMPAITCADNKVTITAEEGAAIYYTIDGTNPTTSSTKYSAPFAIDKDLTVKAIATKDGLTSKVASANVSYVGDYANFAALIAKGEGAKGTILGPITAFYQNGSNLYAIDKDKQPMLFYGSGAPTCVNGTTFDKVSTTYQPYNSTPEFQNTTFGTATAGTAVEPEVLGLDEIAIDMRYKYVKLVGVNVTATAISDADNNSVAVYNKFKITIEDTDNATVTGIVDIFKNAVQVYPISIEGGTVLDPVEAPVFNPAEGEVAAGTQVTISCATADAAIHYTLDGKAPTAASTLYNGPITISENVTVKAIAVKEGMADSPVVTAAYTIKVAGQTTLTFDFNKDGNVKTLTTTAIAASNVQKDEDANNLSGVQFINGAATLWIVRGEGNAPRFWAGTSGDTELRFYNGNTLNISVNTNGYKIASIEFPQGFGKNWPVPTADNTVPANGTWSSRTWTAPADAVVTDFRINATATMNVGAVKVVLAEDSSAVSGVEGIEADTTDAPAVYYNLQGVRVANPANGLYIKVQGKTAVKVLVK